MSIDTLRASLPEFAKDVKINLGNVLDPERVGLSRAQLLLIALASAYATKCPEVVQALEGEVGSAIAEGVMTEAAIEASRSAATIMAMNNIYYRFIHLLNDAEYSKLPAGLRMQCIANPGVSKIDFELMSLAVSAITGCGMCIESHVKHLQEAGVAPVDIQASIKVAAVVNSASTALSIESCSVR